MAEKIKLDEFLRLLVDALNKRLELMESKVESLKMNRISQEQYSEDLKSLRNRVTEIEMTINTARDLNMVDSSILEILEGEDNVRRD